MTFTATIPKCVPHTSACAGTIVVPAFGMEAAHFIKRLKP
jgi:hypothetical protein